MSAYKDYDYPDARPCHVFKELEKPLMSLLNKDTNSSILDLGCGNGHLVNYLLARGFNAYGIDASKPGVAIADKINPGRFFVHDLSIEGLPEPLKGTQFNTIISTEVIEHLYDPYAFIRLCRDVLSESKGELILSTPYHGYLKNLFLSILNKWDNHISPLWQGGHIKFWSVKTLTQILNEHGFEVTAFRGCGRFPYFWMTMIIKAKLK
jgi:2-polyprenyl-3-methyl-5-hydroxy-6-metoxy-1,4-benzoquinol methylase